ncbi:MAG: Crp/Fnr family transcriptional regulator [Nitratireductor sp.]|nr:Crp/Fnr family transcriptional regulator [Nitratireductor sp.]
MQTLSIIPLFSELSEEISQRHARSCFWKDYDPHELVIDVEDETTDVRFVINGKVRIIHRIAVGKEVILNEMADGEFFGEIAAIDGWPRSANVTTLTRSRICIMPQKTFLEVLADSPDVSLKVMRMLARRVRDLNMRLAEHSFLQAKHRLYSELLRLSKPRAGHPDQRSVTPPPIQRELADRIGTRREVVSRELNALEKQGHIMKTKGAIVLLNPDELQRRISEAWDE